MNEDLLKLHDRICTSGREIMQRKNADYGGNKVDPFGNLRFCEHLFPGEVKMEQGILIRMGDKIKRLSTLIRQAAKVKDETMEDTVVDLLNYGVLLLAAKKSRESTVKARRADPKNRRKRKSRSGG